MEKPQDKERKEDFLRIYKVQIGTEMTKIAFYLACFSPFIRMRKEAKKFLKRRKFQRMRN